MAGLAIADRVQLGSRQLGLCRAAARAAVDGAAGALADAQSG